MRCLGPSPLTHPTDREYFIDQLGNLIEETETVCYA